METYEALANLSGEMLHAARNAEWNLLVRLEQNSRTLVERLPTSFEGSGLDAADHARRRQILLRIISDDAEIRNLVEPWMHEARQFLTSLKLERRMQSACSGAGAE